jgi:DNA processing protein
LQRLIKVPGIEQHTAQSIKVQADSKTVSEKIRYIEKNQIKVITCWDDNFPPRLANIYDPPVILFYKGDLSVLDSPTIGVVGMRNPSSYGFMVTEKLCRDLLSYNFTIISGLARGVDTIVHQTVLKNDGKTAAIMGSGIDNIYPPENKKLASEIAERGLLISEYMIGAIPDPGNFPRRNRIISGLSLGILVTEAGIKSGALITAYQALDQNREVFAVPGPINSRKSMGTNQIIRQGATLVQESSHILEELKNLMRENENETERSLPQLSGFEKELYQLLNDQPQHIDELAKNSKCGTAEILSTLLTLELMGIVRQLSGKMFVRAPL